MWLSLVWNGSAFTERLTWVNLIWKLSGAECLIFISQRLSPRWYKTVTILTPVNNDQRAPKDSGLISVDERAHMACREEQAFKKRGGRWGGLTREAMRNQKKLNNQNNISAWDLDGGVRMNCPNNIWSLRFRKSYFFWTSASQIP